MHSSHVSVSIVPLLMYADVDCLYRQTWKLSTMIKNNIVFFSPCNFHFSVGSWSQCIQLNYLPCSLAYACAIYARLSRFVLCFVPWGCMLLAVTQHTEYTACVAAWALASYECQLLLIILLLLLYSCAEGLLQKKNCNSLTKTITFFQTMEDMADSEDDSELTPQVR